MKKLLITVILLISFLNMRFYPYLGLYNNQMQADNNVNIEMHVNHSGTIAVGALGVGETITGFTLAEVLITLTVIGVIAALTIPSLIQNIQDQQYKTAWKRAYSDINQATQKIMTDNAGTLVSVFSGQNNLRDKYLAYLSYVKSCDNGLAAGNCWHNPGVVKELNGNDTTYFDGGSAAILSNGDFFRFYYNSNTCTSPYGSLNICGSVAVDVNGFNGPNIEGKDIFMALILSDRTTPAGVGTAYPPSTDCTSSGKGLGCSAKYLEQ